MSNAMPTPYARPRLIAEHELSGLLVSAGSTVAVSDSEIKHGLVEMGAYERPAVSGVHDLGGLLNAGGSGTKDIAI